MDFAYTISGFCVGLLVGLTGVGGGSLMTPLLVLLFGIHPTTAVGTDLMYAAITKSAGTAVHSLKGTIDWRVTGLLAAGSVPATAATFYLMWRLGVHGAGLSHLISLMLGIALVITSLSLFFRGWLAAFAIRHASVRHPLRTATLTILTGAVLGGLVSLSSVGAGAIGVTVLLLLYPQLPTKRIVGSDIAHAVPLTLIAGLGHWALGSVDWHMLAALVLGSLPGIMLGSALSAKAPDKLLRHLLGVTLLMVGARLVFR